MRRVTLFLNGSPRNGKGGRCGPGWRGSNEVGQRGWEVGVRGLGSPGDGAGSPRPPPNPRDRGARTRL
ncbi:hypothetical protein P7K49_027591 [Saguinus oedipus]|uniref:Uncharacterized protein n=1 Tax=Saguinus oedipus TaxID=9490 RepID=A0ABQ9U9Y8_SAGOE|nr:hypothetical protein P7K49_027591 [Saguinus oedipus]